MDGRAHARRGAVVMRQCLAIVLALAACAPEPYPLAAGVGYCRDLTEPVSLTLDSRWAADDAEAIIAAADAWSAATGVRWAISVGSCEVGDWRRACTTKGWDHPARGGLDGMPTKPGIVIYTHELERAGADLGTVVAHELGHYLGAEHTDAGVMAPMPEPVAPVAVDLGECGS